MSRILGMILAGGLVLGTAGVARAQIGVTIGNPAAYGYGNGLMIGTPGYGLGVPYPGGYSYRSGYSGYIAPRPYLAPPVYGAPVYGYGYRRGFRPFRPYRRYWW